MKIIIYVLIFAFITRGEFKTSNQILEFDGNSQRLKVDRLKNFLMNTMRERSKLMDQVIAISKENGSTLRRVYKVIEKGNESVANSITELENYFCLNNISTKTINTCKTADSNIDFCLYSK